MSRYKYDNKFFRRLRVLSPTEIFILSVILILLLWTANELLLTSKTAGETGDKFGMVNSLFSGLAFATLIYTILLQRQDIQNQQIQLKQNEAALEKQSKSIDLQTRQLRDQKHELELTRQEFDKQNETLKLQRFENTFFNLLNNLINTPKIIPPSSHVYSAMKPEEVTIYQNQFPNKNDKEEQTYVVAMIINKYREKEVTDISKGVISIVKNHILALLYGRVDMILNIIRYVDSYQFEEYTEDMEEVDYIGADAYNKRKSMFYINTLISQLYDYELLLIAITVSEIPYYAKDKRLVEAYHILNRVKRDSIFSHRNLKSSFLPSAFSNES
jgi:hypothetical protein